MKDGLKSLLIEEHIHHMAKKHCANNKSTIKKWVEQLIVDAITKTETKPKKK